MPGNTVVITGCSSGLGKLSAQTFAAKGWELGFVLAGDTMLGPD